MSHQREEPGHRAIGSGEVKKGSEYTFLKFFFLFFFFFFDVDYIEFVTILLLFYVLGCFFFFGRGACGVLSPQPGIKPAPLALEGEVLITGLPENSLHFNIVVVV